MNRIYYLIYSDEKPRGYKSTSFRFGTFLSPILFLISLTN